MPKGYWCYKVLPLVYDDSVSYYEVLCKIVKYLNGLIADMKKCGEDVGAISEEVKVLKVEIDRLDALYGELSTEVGFYGDRITGLENGLRGVGERLRELFGEVSDLRDEVGDISTSVTSLSNDLNNLDSAVDNLGDRVDSIDNAVSGVESDVSELNDKVPFAFGVENGEYGYYEEGSQTLTPFGGGGGAIEFGRKIRGTAGTPIRIPISDLEAGVTYLVTGIRDSGTATDGYALIAFINRKHQLHRITYSQMSISQTSWYAPSLTEGYEVVAYGTAYTICVTPMYKMFE